MKKEQKDTQESWETATMKAGDVEPDELVVPVNVAKMMVSLSIASERERLIGEAKQELEVAETALGLTKNVDKITFYEGYIKGLKAYLSILQAK